MWVKIDDEFCESRKVFAAAGHLGGAGASGRVIAVYLEGLCWANRKHTDGVLLLDEVRAFRHDRRPLAVAAALEAAGLWEPCDQGWRIHDYHEYQPTAEQRSALSEARAAAGRRGAAVTNQKRQTGRQIAEQTVGNVSGITDGKPVGNVPSESDKPVGNEVGNGAATATPRYPVPEDLDQNQDQDPRPPAGPRPVEHRPPDTNPALVRRIIHELIECAEPHTTEADLKELTKRRCAQLRVAYDADVIRVALDNVQHTRRRREGAFA